MKNSVRLEVSLPHAPEKVWEALTQPAALSAWLMPAEFEPKIGFRYRFERPSGSPIHGKVLEVEAGRMIAFTWNDDDEGEQSVVVWSIDPTDGGATLRVDHRQVEQPYVNTLAVDAHFNWLYALTHGLPGLLRLLEASRSRAPMVYAGETR